METKLGYEDALNKVFDVRLERYKKYKDSWKLMEDWELMAFIKEKVRRLEGELMEGQNRKEVNTEHLIDLINYSLFLLQKKIEE